MPAWEMQSCFCGRWSKRALSYILKSGVVDVAKLLAKNKIVINKSWDKAVIPLPFSKMVQIYGDPVYISSEDSIEEKTVLVEERLNKLFEFTDKYYWNKNILNGSPFLENIFIWDKRQISFKYYKNLGQ